MAGKGSAFLAAKVGLTYLVVLAALFLSGCGRAGNDVDLKPKVEAYGVVTAISEPLIGEKEATGYHAEKFKIETEQGQVVYLGRVLVPTGMVIQRGDKFRLTANGPTLVAVAVGEEGK